MARCERGQGELGGSGGTGGSPLTFHLPTHKWMPFEGGSNGGRWLHTEEQWEDLKDTYGP